MTIVAGVDFGTLSVRVSIVDDARGLIASAVAEYPLHRRPDDPDYATQSHDDQMEALAKATRQAVREAGVAGADVAAIALDTTGSSVIPVDGAMQPLSEYYLWCDHRAKGEAEEITAAAHRAGAGGDRVVRRRVFGGMGVRQAAALAAPQSGPARRLRQRVRELRHGGGDARRHHRPAPGQAQRLRHGP